jgi:putative ABC transport system ATP-binding protein
MYIITVQFELKSISKTYGKKEGAFEALKDVSLRVKNAETLGIVGKSGSGKSTLMHIMATLDAPTVGTVIYNGNDLSKLSDKQIDELRNREFGFVFQQFFLKANETVLENVALPLKLAGVSTKERNARALSMLKQMGLEDKANNKATDLSGGQKQRVCIARALVTEPKVIFADEPTGNLDTDSGKAVINILFELNKTKGITLIIVTHDDDLAAKCRRQVRLKDGRVEGKS